MDVSMPRLYLSFDIEADGECPVLSNMLSLGIVALTAQGQEVFTFQRNILETPDRHPSDRCLREFWHKNQTAWDFVHSDSN